MHVIKITLGNESGFYKNIINNEVLIVDKKDDAFIFHEQHKAAKSADLVKFKLKNAIVEIKTLGYAK